LATEGADLLFAALATHPALTALDVQDNHIGHIGARHAAKMLQTNRHLETLNMAKNSIGDEGLRWLLPSFGLNVSLRHLDLKGNNLGSEHASRLAAIMSETVVYRVIDTAHNRRGCPERFLSPVAEAERDEIKGVRPKTIERLPTLPQAKRSPRRAGTMPRRPS